ncbi:MAG: type II toxin-antitoxin system MqsA family antitoxin [Nitrospiria bacterium]
MIKHRTNLPVEFGEGLLFIKNVPADICSQCGETFIPDKVASLLEKMVNKAKASHIDMGVVSYEKVA